MTTTTDTPASIVAQVKDTEGTILARIGALISLVVGLIALFHPGFTETGRVRAIVTAVALAGAVLIVAIHLVTQRGLKGAALAAWGAIESVSKLNVGDVVDLVEHPATAADDALHELAASTIPDPVAAPPESTATSTTAAPATEGSVETPIVTAITAPAPAAEETTAPAPASTVPTPAELADAKQAAQDARDALDAAEAVLAGLVAKAGGKAATGS